MTTKNLKAMFTTYFIMFGILIILLGSVFNYFIQMSHSQESIDKKAEQVAYNKKFNLLKPSIEKLDNIVSSLATDRTLLAYILHPNNETKINVSNVFLAITKSDINIMQTRFIGADGKEKIRIDRAKNIKLPFVIEDKNLQDKCDRDYFKILSRLPKGTIWHSKLDLNIEHGKIEVPFQPTIRIATPIYEKDKFVGIVIINMLANQLLYTLHSAIEFDYFIIDKDGYFIIHPNSKYSWSKYTNVAHKLTDEFHAQASQIIAGASKGKDFYAYNLNDVLKNDDNAILVLQPKGAYTHAILIAHIETAFLLGILTILFSIPIAYYMSLIPIKLQRALIQSHKELKLFATLIDKYVVTATTNASTTITSVSSAFEKVSGYTKKELVGQKMHVIKDANTSAEVYKDMWNKIGTGNEWTGELKNKHKDGKEYWLEQTISPVLDENKNIIAYTSFGINITDKKILEIQAMIDGLTSVYNRRKLNEDITNEVAKANRYQRSLSLIMIDIDYFKKVNDTFGHQIGDYALKNIASILSKNIRSTDILGRYGGEEFMVICPETDKDAVAITGEKLRKAVSVYDFDNIGHLTVSIGATELNENDTVADLILKADTALYKAKAAGRNQVVFVGKNENE
ncbi:MAG: diguanylate cyclase [Campylobacteraceae bacterium]|nr:diguanylate cyclase [Campylobacteraceae bacterium]